MKKAVLVFSVMFIFSLNPLLGQEKETKKPSLGISAEVPQKNVDVWLSIFASENFLFETIFSIASLQDIGSDIGVGLGGRNLFGDNKARPYIGARIQAYFFSPKNGSKTTDFVITPRAGAEYFFDDFLSVAAEVGLSVTISDDNSLRFGLPGRTNLSTGTVIFATIYF